MEQYLLENIIHLYHSKLAASSRNLKKKAGKGDIHRFRTDIKKLRAFYRLLSLGAGEGKGLQLPRHLKKMYAAVGRIRELQLQIKSVKDVSANKAQQPGALLVTLRRQ